MTDRTRKILGAIRIALLLAIVVVQLMIISLHRDIEARQAHIQDQIDALAASTPAENAAGY